MRLFGIAPSIRSRAAVLSAAALTVAALAACTPDPNPGWPATGCNANVAILIDRSSSIGDASYGGSQANVNTVKAAVKGMIDQVTDSNINLYIGAFATQANYDAYQFYGGGYIDVPSVESSFSHGSAAKAKAAVDAIPFGGTSADPNYNTYGAPSGVGRGRTNWYGAIKKAPAGANLIIIATDGDPTWYDGADPATNGSGVDQADVDMAIGAANDAKKNKTRVVAVHFGDKNAGGPYGGWEQRVQGVTYYSAGSDYWATNYAGMASALSAIASKGCVPPTVTTVVPTVVTTTTTRPVVIPT